MQHWFKLHTGLQATWILCLSAVRLWFIHEIIWKEDFGLQRNGPHETLMMLSLVREWLDTRNATHVAYFRDSEHGCSWCIDSSLSSTLWHSPKFLNGLCLTIKALVIFYCASFLPVSFSWTYFDTALCKQPGLSAFISWLWLELLSLPSLLSQLSITDPFIIH